MIDRETFTALEVQEFAASSGLLLVGPARIAASLLNGVIYHYAPMIAQRTETRLHEASRDNVAAAERGRATAHKLRQLLPLDGGGFSGSLQQYERLSLHEQLAAVERDADDAIRQAKVVWGSASMKNHDLRDFLGGALPAAFELIFERGTRAQRVKFIRFATKPFELGERSAETLRQAATRFKAARKKGADLNLPDLLAT